MKLSIVICAYNERRSILSVLDGTRQVALPEGWEREIILVDNASTDGTQDLLRAVKGPGIKVVFHPRNLGKGASIRTGFGHATGDYVVIQDADTEYDPADLARLLEKAIEVDADAVFGSRVLDGEAQYHYASAYWGVRALTTLTNLLCGGRLTDVAVATKMVRRSILPGLALRGEHFDLDFELPVKLLRAGYRIHEVPVSYRPRTYAEGKKIKPVDGLRALWVIVRERFRPGAPVRTA